MIEKGEVDDARPVTGHGQPQVGAGLGMQKEQPGWAVGGGECLLLIFKGIGYDFWLFLFKADFMNIGESDMAVIYLNLITQISLFNFFLASPANSVLD